MQQISLPKNKTSLIRVLAMQAITNQTLIDPINEANDVKIMFNAINAKKTFDFEDAGTPSRFLLAIFCVLKFPIVLTTFENLKNRPCKPLLTCLESLGAQFKFIEKDYTFPIRIIKGINPFSSVTINGVQSSQFISAIALLACTQNTKVIIHYSISSSKAYLNQTLQIIKLWGYKVKHTKNTIFIKKGLIENPKIPIENDFSSFLFMVNLASLNPNKEFLATDLKLGSLQADEKTIPIYIKLGFIFTQTKNGLIFSYTKNKVKKLALNIGNYLDSFPAIVAIAQKFEIIIHFKNWENLIVKESNRVKAMKMNLKPFGSIFIETNGILKFIPGSIKPKNITIYSFNDHRIVMAMSLFSKTYITTIDNTDCVKKSFPNFWNEFEKMNSFNLV